MSKRNSTAENSILSQSTATRLLRINKAFIENIFTLFGAPTTTIVHFIFWEVHLDDAR